MAKKQLETIVRIDKLIYPKVFHTGDWCVLSVYDKDTYRFYTIKGNVFELNYDITYKLIGEYEKNEKYGEQYNIVVFTPYNELKSAQDFKNFLSTIIAENYVYNIFTTLDDPILAIKNGDIEELCKVKGIKEYTANRIIEKYRENSIYIEAFVELGKYGITNNMIKKIITKYQNVNSALIALKTNPYELITIPNIGWKKADEVAQKMGFDIMSIERLCAYIRYYLNEQALEGNSWLTLNQLVDAIFKMYEESNVRIAEKKAEILSLIKEALKQLKEKRIVYWNDKKTFICLSKYYNLELKISKELKRLLNGENNLPYKNVEDIVKEIENEKGYTLTDEQINAIKLACEKNVLIITGSAGSGKTTAVYGILKALNAINFAQCALSGKASSNLQSVTGKQGSTIHRLLKYNPLTMGFEYNKYIKLPYDVIVLDEVSMVGGEIFLCLLEAISTGSKLIMLGDDKQLPSIGVMNLLKDMLNSNAIPVQTLTKIHRQAAKSAIITESFKVKDGKQITEKDYVGTETRGELQDFTLDIYRKGVSTTNRVIEHFEKEFDRLQDINKIQIIVPMRERGNASAFAINLLIQDIYNPLHIEQKAMTFKRLGREFQLRVGDKVINRKNNYAIQKANSDELTQIFNGYIGTVIDVMPEEKAIIVKFEYNDVGNVYITGEQLQHIDLGYCCTVHSYQGSQCDTVIIGVDYASYKLLSKELIYTAITRAQKKCILCAETSALRFAISQSNVISKQTFLESMLNRDDLILIETDDIFDEEYEECDDIYEF